MKRRRQALTALTLAASGLLFAGCQPELTPPPEFQRTAPWPKDALAAADQLPIQDRGRVKPLSTYAGFQLLKINGKRKLKIQSGETLTPLGWLLDCMLFPEQAKTYDAFRIEDTDLLTRIGLSPRLKPNGAPEKRGHYSFAFLQPQLGKLFELAQTYSRKSQLDGAESLESVESQIVDLAGKVNEFHSLIQTLHFARAHYHVRETGGLKSIFGAEGGEDGTLSEILTHAEGMFFTYRELESPEVKAKVPEERRLAEQEAINELLLSAKDATQRSSRLAFFPPPAANSLAWLSVDGLFQERFKSALEGSEVSYADAIKALQLVEGLEANKTDPAAFTQAIQALQSHVKTSASARGEWWKIPLETHYYRADWFYRALLLFVLGFLLVAATWFFPANQRLYWTVFALLGVATLVVVIGITERCVIRSRPPVSTLYETILFITATSSLVALGIEWINRQRVALSVTPILGAAGMFLAMRYEFRDAVSSGDTMGSLVAVLDTNFWLSTHVTTVTLGYSAGLLAAALAHVWLFAKAFNLGQRAFYRTVARMTYGVLCFGLLFSVVGTILGGIWANYSWGRFWGWDPKENGALLIVLWELAIIHARMGGYVRDLGMCVMAVLGGCVVAFSWWGVNLLNVGLHSYGFTEGAQAALYTFYGLEVLVVVLTGVAIAAHASGAKAAGAGGAD